MKKSYQELLNTLEMRFNKNMSRHKGFKWEKVKANLLANPNKLRSLNEMEQSGGEPDVVDYDKKSKKYLFIDCSAESPSGRRSLCYDQKALASRKEAKPQNNVLDLVKSMGVELLDEEQYRNLQKLGNFDLKTSSWIKTPNKIRELGGALFCDCRYEEVFVYHNGAQSYFASRGFRCSLDV